MEGDPCASRDCSGGEVCAINNCGACQAQCTLDVVPLAPIACEEVDNCGTGEFCHLEIGVCNSESIQNGTCKKKPEACIFVMDPVCGCDENTYSNECDAQANGVSVSRKGDCEDNLPVTTTIAPDPVGTTTSAADPVVSTTVATTAGPVDEGCDEGVLCFEEGSSCVKGSETC